MWNAPEADDLEDFISARHAKAWAKTPAQLEKHLASEVMLRMGDTDSPAAFPSHDDKRVGYSVQTKYDGHRLHVHIWGRGGTIHRVEARSRVALKLVAGARDKWERVVKPWLLADRGGRIGAALQSGATTTAGAVDGHGDAVHGTASFYAVLECELCSRLDRTPFGNLHREVSSEAHRRAVLVVFDLHKEAGMPWHAQPLHRRLARLDALRTAITMVPGITRGNGDGGGECRVLDPVLHWGRRWHVPPT